MAVNTSKCDLLAPLHFKGLLISILGSTKSTIPALVLSILSLLLSLLATLV